jgi:hypothetical protein
MYEKRIDINHIYINPDDTMKKMDIEINEFFKKKGKYPTRIYVPKSHINWLSPHTHSTKYERWLGTSFYGVDAFIGNDKFECRYIHPTNKYRHL